MVMRRVARPVALRGHGVGPLEHELVSYEQRLPQLRNAVQAGDYTLDIRRIFGSHHRRGPRRIRTLAVLASPGNVRERREALRSCHLSPLACIPCAQSSLAPLLLTLLAHPVPRTGVFARPRDESASASCRTAVDSVRQAKLCFDHIVHEIVRDVIIVTRRWVHRARPPAGDGDDDCVTPGASALEADVHHVSLNTRAERTSGRLRRDRPRVSAPLSPRRALRRQRPTGATSKQNSRGSVFRAALSLPSGSSHRAGARTFR